MVNKIRIKVGATSANLGPGFDSLGIALNIYDIYEFELSNEYSTVGFEDEYNNVSSNLIIEAYKKYGLVKNLFVKPVKVSLIKSSIPISRGLGSSAACIIAGVKAAAYFLSINDEMILNVATLIEGHPDNVVPCFTGNLCASFIDDNHVYYGQYKVSSDISILAIYPRFKLRTDVARKILPTQLNYETCVYNLSRVSLVTKGFETGDLKLLYHAMKDEMHEKYRYKFINGIDLLKEFACTNKYPLVISGSGPTILMVVDKNFDVMLLKNLVDQQWLIRKVKVDKKGAMIYEC